MMPFLNPVTVKTEPESAVTAKRYEAAGQVEAAPVEAAQVVFAPFALVMGALFINFAVRY
jgi:hypothetical protein